MSTNIIGSFNLLQIIKDFKIDHLLLASTSSIYGANTELPFKEIQKTDIKFPPMLQQKNQWKLFLILIHIYMKFLQQF